MSVVFWSDTNPHTLTKTKYCGSLGLWSLECKRQAGKRLHHRGWSCCQHHECFIQYKQKHKHTHSHRVLYPPYSHEQCKQRRANGEMCTCFRHFNTHTHMQCLGEFYQHQHEASVNTVWILITWGDGDDWHALDVPALVFPFTRFRHFLEYFLLSSEHKLQLIACVIFAHGQSHLQTQTHRTE